MLAVQQHVFATGRARTEASDPILRTRSSASPAGLPRYEDHGRTDRLLVAGAPCASAAVSQSHSAHNARFYKMRVIFVCDFRAARLTRFVENMCNIFYL
jgi:hypothetical protein